MPRFLRVNMQNLTAHFEDAPMYAGLGGRGLTSLVVAKEVPPRAHPLGAENKVVLAPGLLGGTLAPCSGRLSVGAKSPLTGGIKESNAGGTAAQALAQSGIDALIVEGKPQSGGTYVLHIKGGSVALEEAHELRFLSNYKLVARLRKAYGEHVSCITIGPAGERQLTAASVAVTDLEGRPTRHAGRGGLGAVLGSKGLKAIVVSPTKHASTSQDRERLRKAAKAFALHLHEHPITGKALPTYGTNILANIINAVGGYPTRNFSSGQFEGTQKISGEEERRRIVERGGNPRHACHHGCTIRCSRIYVNRQGKFLSKGPEYETVWAHGANCGIDDLDAIARMDLADDDIGLDTIEMGATFAVAMESGLLDFGDARGVVALLDEVRKGTDRGRMLGCGAKLTGQMLGVARVPVVKGQALPAYDPRAVKGIGVTYATSPMGADHTAGYTICQNVLSVGGKVDPLSREGQIEVSRTLQVATAALDSTGLCLFVAFCLLDRPQSMEGMMDMLNAHLGFTWSLDDFVGLGKKILRAEWAFNDEAGLGRTADRLPRFFQNEPLPPHNAIFDIHDTELDRVHEL